MGSLISRLGVFNKSQKAKHQWARRRFINVSRVFLLSSDTVDKINDKTSTPYYHRTRPSTMYTVKPIILDENNYHNYQRNQYQKKRTVIWDDDDDDDDDDDEDDDDDDENAAKDQNSIN